MKSILGFGKKAKYVFLFGIIVAIGHAFLRQNSEPPRPANQEEEQRPAATAEPLPQPEALSPSTLQQASIHESQNDARSAPMGIAKIEEQKTASSASRSTRKSRKLANEAEVEDSQQEKKTMSAQPAPTTREEAKETDVTSAQEKRAGARLFAAIGVNYVQYDENFSDVDAHYRDLSGPSYLLGTAFEVGKQFGLELIYKKTPMKFDNSTVDFQKLSGEWQTLGMHGTWLSDTSYAQRLANTVSGLDTSQDQLRYFFGAQTHTLPVILFGAADNTPFVRSLLLANLSLGVAYEHLFNEYTRSQVYLRYQHPFSAQPLTSGATMKITPNLLFDGSIGVEKQLVKNSWLGMFWYGQYQQMKVKFSDSEITAEGTHKVLFSNIELRYSKDF